MFICILRYCIFSCLSFNDEKSISNAADAFLEPPLPPHLGSGVTFVEQKVAPHVPLNHQEHILHGFHDDLYSI